jgi:hypothetical protein
MDPLTSARLIGGLVEASAAGTETIGGGDSTRKVLRLVVNAFTG